MVPNEQSEHRPLSRDQMNDLRRAVFGCLSADDSRWTAGLGVDAERMARHLVEAWPPRRRARLRISELHLADVALAVACIDTLPGAWARLIERHEPVLVQAAEQQQTPTQAVVTVRRMFIEMRRDSAPGCRGTLSLARYCADTSIEAWLLERLTGRLAVNAAVRRAEDGKRRADTVQRLRVALDLLGAERMSVQALAASLAATSADLRREVAAGASLRHTPAENKHG
jgi:hypothetical protein